MGNVRVRFAPSPTGPLHIGGVRTALYNYLFAKKNNGTFILRIEDTDQTRFVPGAEEYIMESLEWSGIKIDEGIREGGNYGPYRQSDRKEIYKKYADELVEKGFAYYAFDTAEELESLRKKLEEEKASNTSYSSAIRMQMKNSLTYSKEEVTALIEKGEPYVVRYKMPENEDIKLTDIIRGEMVVNSSTLDDKVLFKSDGMPTYHLANVVDDHLMEVSHVIRGEEWLPSLPLHIMLYRSFGWSAPEFAHLPLLLKPAGSGKLSKRDGDKLGFPVFPLEWKDSNSGEVSMGYRESGYFPEAFINMLALLGWNSGTEQEIFSMEELINSFSLERVSKSGARFDPDKAKWFNHQYMLSADNNLVAEILKSIASEKVPGHSNNRYEEISSLVKERAVFPSELWEHSSFFFVRPETYDEKIIQKKWKEDTPELLRKISSLISDGPFEKELLETRVKKYMEDNQIAFGNVFNALRLVLVGGAKGPDLFSIIDILGQEESVQRIEIAISVIK